MDKMMGYMREAMRDAWSWMIDPPWRHSGPDDYKFVHWLGWLMGWAWAIAGLLLGAFVAPSIAQKVGLGHTQVEGTFEIAVSVVAGFLVQLVGWVVMIIIGTTVLRWLEDKSLPRAVRVWVPVLIFALLPLAAVGYAIYRYLAFVGPGQKLVTTAAVGGFLVKAFLIPLIKGIVTGVALKNFTDWIRGNQASNR